MIGRGYAYAVAVLTALSSLAQPLYAQPVQQAPFGKTADGKTVHIYTLTNANGVEARISDFGATLVSLKTPDKNGTLGSVVLGFDTVEPYVKGVPFYGATIGRFGNRIANGTFVLDGKTYKLATNDGPNALHGGVKGFDKVMWKALPIKTTNGAALRLTYVSRDGEEEYPGTLNVSITYTLENDNSLHLVYDAKTTKPTVVNLTNHSYFNLTADPEKSIEDLTLTLNADTFTPVSKVLIPTGELRPVTGTPFDFRQPTKIGARIAANDEQLTFAGGYDHNWVLVKPTAGAMTLAAELSDPVSGRVMKITTDQPGIQFYSGNFMDGKPAGTGTVYKHRTGLCLETQHFPDSPNQSAFPTTTLRPGQRFHSETVLSFSVVK